MKTRLTVGPDATLEWLPQETILFSGARLARRFDVAVQASSRLLMVEMIVLGRTASGEAMVDGSLNDQWRVSRDGRLVFADALRIGGDIAAAMQRSAIGGGARATALILLVAPDAERHLDRVRGVLDGTECDCGASTWNGLLAVRAVARDTAELRRVVIACATAITGRAMPRVWSL
jgi:urease accessory protein